MAKVVCESCETSFNYEAVKDFEYCPVCGKPLWKSTTDDAKKEVLSFGEGFELGENDSFDADKIDFWWYSIREPGEVWEGITYKNGDVFVNCAKCGNFAGSIPYPIARTGDYLLMDPRYTDRCRDCGNEMRNHIISKRPADWVDPRPKACVPKCPTCGSTKIRKISVTSKAASVAMWGVLSRKVHKQWHCDFCGSEW